MRTTAQKHSNEGLQCYNTKSTLIYQTAEKSSCHIVFSSLPLSIQVFNNSKQFFLESVEIIMLK